MLTAITMEESAFFLARRSCLQKFHVFKPQENLRAISRLLLFGDVVRKVQFRDNVIMNFKQRRVISALYKMNE